MGRATRLKQAARTNAHRRAARARAGENNPSGMGQPGPGTRNGYHCRDCGQTTVTVHADAGVTPMLIACKAADCGGPAFSLMYRATAEQLGPPTHEWYRPADPADLERTVREHVAKGGLLLRELGRITIPTGSA